MLGARSRCLVVIATSAILAGTFAACGSDDDGASGDGTADSAGETLPVRIGVFAGVEEIPWLATVRLAEEKGFYEEAGLEPTIIVASGGGDTIRLVASGEADVSIASPDATYTATADPANELRLVGVWHNYMDPVWVGMERVDLDGASMAISSAGSLGEMLLKAVEGEMPDVSFELETLGALGTQWAAARAGRVDGAMTAPPFQYVQEDEGGEVILTPRDTLGDIPGDLVAASEDYIDSTGGEGVARFLEAMDATFRYVRENRKQAAEELGELTETPTELVLRSFRETPNFDDVYSMKVDCDVMENLSATLQAADVIDEPVNWSEALDQQYLPEEDRCPEFE